MGASDELNLQISGQIVPLRCIAHHHKAIELTPCQRDFRTFPQARALKPTWHVSRFSKNVQEFITGSRHHNLQWLTRVPARLGEWLVRELATSS